MSGDRPWLIPAAYVVLRKGALGDTVLLQRRSGTGYIDGFWSVAAAGHAAFGESIIEAACRELAEELDVRAEPADMRALCAMHRVQGADADRDQRVDFFFECMAWIGDPKFQGLDKADALEWISINSLTAPMVPHEAEVLEGLRAGRLAPIVTHGV